MKVTILSENCYKEALFGLGLSYGLTSDITFEQFKGMPELQERIHGIAVKNAPMGKGHNKFMYQMGVVIDADLPRYMWPELDQYKISTVTQSESTMHTIHKREITREDFEFDYFIDADNSIEQLNKIRNNYIETKNKMWWRALIQTLPQSYLQRRIWTGNYANLRNIIDQRTGHKLKEWAVFIDAVKSQCQHPELLA